ncbi:ABC transporter permease [Parendozoicomonas haliclonae]|uniref:Branched-chain amino acid transport system / permease component n=1 Tax=Parendozoicomonas haliclonae TaxID=1960125 RepID=A0A1X7ALI7_9GAMM|nr:ABC transporter permease [Parendozoicomonas haliclonae]SMA48491.1 Branched-chain amino acid transport system / permease component [Parendozoicomonas haliclonae]
MNPVMAESPAWVRVALIPFLQLVLALAISSLVVLIIGEDPIHAFQVMIRGATNTDFGGISNTLYYATNFIFTGLAVAVAFHAGLFNIGGEGQVYVAGLAVALLCLALDSTLNAWFMAPLIIIGTALFGAIWGAVPGYLQARRGSHIVVTTIMFNYIAMAFMSYMLVEYISKLGGNSTDSRYWNAEAVIPKMHEISSSFPYSLLNPTILLALGVSAAVWVLIWRTRLGFAIRTVGSNPEAAKYAGIDAGRIIIITMAISGALAGMMAVNEVYAAQSRLILNFPNGAGFMGIAVALMGRNHPVGIVFAALLFGAMNQGGTELQFEIPSISPQVVLVIQALVVFFTGALDQLLRGPIENWFQRRAIARSQQAAAQG